MQRGVQYSDGKVCSFQAEKTKKTAHRAFTVFREAMYNATIGELNDLALTGAIEMDEALFGGKRHGKRGWGSAGKQMVFGMYMCNGKVLTFPISSRSREELLPLIKAHTRPGSLYYTDDWHAYGSLPVRGNHVVVRKEKGMPRGRDHLNGIEGFWSFAKNWLYQYRGVPQHHFHLYLKEIEFRFNHRNDDLFKLVTTFFWDATIITNPLDFTTIVSYTSSNFQTLISHLLFTLPNV